VNTLVTAYRFISNVGGANTRLNGADAGSFGKPSMDASASAAVSQIHEYAPLAVIAAQQQDGCIPAAAYQLTPDQ
jgi:hypothetical protein